MTELDSQELHDAAAADLTVLAVLMVIGSTAFALVNKWLDTMSWIAVALAIASTLTWSVGLVRRSPVTAAFVRIGFGFGGLGAPVAALAGLGLGLFGYTWGWAVLAGAVLYFGFSVLGFEILTRAEETGVIEQILPPKHNW